MRRPVRKPQKIKSGKRFRTCFSAKERAENQNILRGAFSRFFSGSSTAFSPSFFFFPGCATGIVECSEVSLELNRDASSADTAFASKWFPSQTSVGAFPEEYMQSVVFVQNSPATLPVKLQTLRVVRPEGTGNCFLGRLFCNSAITSIHTG